MSATSQKSGLLAAYLGVVQFFFAVTWIIYVIYLPSLAERAGIGREWIPWILVADQVVFAIADVMTGFWLDRVRTNLVRFGGWILGLTLVSGAAFLVLPFFAVNAGVLLAAVLVWAVTSSALRCPPWALLSRHAATPSLPWLSTLVLTGSALAAAFAPYLGLMLKDIDARIPFVVSTLTLLATVAGLIMVERRLPAPPTAPASASAAVSAKTVAPFFLALLLMAIGFQVCFSLNAAPLFERYADKTDLPYLMPVFWIGFNLAMLIAAWLAKRLGLIETFALAAAVGALAALWQTFAASITEAIGGQLIAGAAWGVASVATYSCAVGFGRTGREGRFLGALFAVLAIAAFVRIAAYASDLVLEPALRALLTWIPQITWLLAAAVLLLARRGLRSGQMGESYHAD